MLPRSGGHRTIDALSSIAMSTLWHERWRDGRISFHEGRVNAFLARHLSRLGTGRRVLVPLCGKAEDLAYLAAAGHEVIGIELVPEAAEAFFDEHPHLREGPVRIVVGDFFATTAADVGPIDAFYDRAALIALPDELRPRYVEHLRRLVAPGAPGLVITIEYRQELAAGPPFAVFEDEVRALWSGSSIELVDEGPAASARLRDAGATPVERCFAIVR